MASLVCLYQNPVLLCAFSMSLTTFAASDEMWNIISSVAEKAEMVNGRATNSL